MHLRLNSLKHRLKSITAQQTDICYVCNQQIPKSFLTLRVPRVLQALTGKNTAHQRIHKAQYMGDQLKYANDLWPCDVLSSQLISKDVGGESSWTIYQKVSFRPGWGSEMTGEPKGMRYRLCLIVFSLWPVLREQGEDLLLTVIMLQVKLWWRVWSWGLFWAFCPKSLHVLPWF